jgi:hypothetical protein
MQGSKFLNLAADHKLPFRVTGKIDKVTIKLGPEQLNAEDHKAKQQAIANVNN